MRFTRAVLIALPLAWALPALASAQYVEPRPYDPRFDPRYGRAPYAQAPWSGEEEVAVAAHQLSESAENLHRLVMRIEGYSPLAARVMRFAHNAERFHRIVEGPPGYSDVLSEFMRLQAEYHTLRGMFFNTHRSHHIEHVVDDWTRLTASFERLALTMGVEDSRLCAIDPRYTRPGRRFRVRPW